MTGLRGVGKTVLLARFEAMADSRGWVPAWAEVSPRFEFKSRMFQLAREALFRLSPKARWSDRLKRTASVLKSFSITLAPDGSMSAGLDVEAAEGTADTGFLDTDLAALLVALGEAAKSQDKGVVLLFDEVQFLAAQELESLVVALHRVNQKSLPITLVGAGLPQLPQLAGEARSYAERLFRFPTVGRLAREEAYAALVEPTEKLGLKFTEGALDRIFAFTDGYPYFLQEFGRLIWNESHGEVLSADVGAAEPKVLAQLDSAFFRVRVDRLDREALTVLRGMAEGEGEIVGLDEIAAEVRLSPDATLDGVMRELTDRAMVYSPRFEKYAFTVPHFGPYLRRRFPFVEGRVVYED